MRLLFLTLTIVLYLAGLAGAASFSDDFTRADNLDLGANWDDGYAGLASCKIASNKVTAQADGESCVETWNATSFTNDQWAEITLGNFSSSFGEASILLRSAAPSTFTFYRVLARKGDAGISSAIQKFVAGVFTLVASENAVTWGPGDILYGEVSGTSITVKRNGISILSTTDSAIASGRIGLNIYLEGATNTTEIESITGGDIIAPTRRRVGVMAFQ